MVKTKQQKSTKPKKNPHVKNQGKQADITQFQSQLDALGLKVIQVTADGNCFFRALADQLEGSEKEHGKYRSMAVQYIMKNREMFEPFIEDEIPFDEYCQSMEKDGTWAGHMELQAASLVTRSNICIHQYMSPRWYIRNFDQCGARMVHLSYHDEEHYNSVRLKEDPCDGPARPIIIEADADLSATSHKAKAAASKSKGGAVKDITDAGSIKLVMAGSGCQNAEKVEQVLLQVDGDADAAIEFLVAEREADDYSAENDTLQCHVDTSHDGEDGNCEQQKEESLKETHKHSPSNNRIKQTHDNSSSQADDKKIPRNKSCPCGSKKKYKACCGAVKGRPAAKFIVNQNIDSRKSRKGRKQGNKGGPAESESNCGPDGGLPDVGALCI
ncbi:OVARIAN TUMOR DOMAIN-containing deubiquitinating enzyme 7 isoform X3 [Hevea brasiliensis]|uniref:OVARIAN TUMOR DOMAIN-containing deubiquitinating enzyme 7 isoform X3 n=1 Tax=Hevea brasiliensis TaxID=3981 RepID=UPI0025ECD4A9|nr:OVARIAN TUMOR DOMAIN-containing deubiquitinating enzyme 7 isoform X3 [Hevea brasiliensis]